MFRKECSKEKLQKEITFINQIKIIAINTIYLLTILML